MDKIVFSRTLQRAPWGQWREAEVVKTRAIDAIAAAKSEQGNHLLMWGSIALAQSVLAADLVDELRLVVCPVTLGTGRPLFRDASQLKLVSAREHDRGSVTLTYSLT